MTIGATFQTKTKTAASVGRTPQADAQACVNFNPFDPEYVRVWEGYYGSLVPDDYVIHHILGDGPHGINPLFLLAMPRHLHTAMHNRARATHRLELPQGWVAVRGVLMPQSDAPARSDHKGQTLVRGGADHKEQSDQRVVGIVASASRSTHRRAVARGTPLPDVPMLPLPDHAGNRARRVYAIVGEMFRARWSVYPDAPIPLTRDYIAKWPDAKIKAKTAERGVHDLVNLGILRVAGTEPSHCGRPMHLYLPAPVTADAVSVTGDAPPVVPEAMPIPLRIRVELRMYADALDDRTDQRPYWRLKGERHVFEPYVPGLFACRGMRACAAMIRARLAEDALMTPPVTEVVPVDVVPCPVASAVIALEVLQSQIETDLANFGAHPTHTQQVAFYRLFCEATRQRHFISARSPDGGRAFVASPLNLWFSQLNWVVSSEALQEVDRKEAREKASLPHRFSTTAVGAFHAG